ncbi:hypothetical protein Q5P01_001960 [Channa striata]|uniref:Uncharacterized protein n=1 Tax=Channa striata TaxID=64152 RepID=A0AA88T4D8_CHASR|nr:hypothetical protein Q5P01_001960 [Channa striata]
MILGDLMGVPSQEVGIVRRTRFATVVDCVSVSLSGMREWIKNELSKVEGKNIVWREIKEWRQYWDREKTGRQLSSIQSNVRSTRSRGGKRKEDTGSNMNDTSQLIGNHQTGLCEECQEHVYGKLQEMQHRERELNVCCQIIHVDVLYSFFKGLISRI